jgi:pimeloyl-ACP methyl ester carboxylesterase
VKPVLIPLAERLGRMMLRRRGISSSHVETHFGPMFTYDAPGAGNLPTTVVLHGLGSAATPFGPVLARLQRHVRRIVAPDFPGHGFSRFGHDAPLTPARLFDCMSTALNASLREPAIVIGNSLGGAVALRYAVAHPERVRALVLVSPAGALSSDEEWHALRRTFRVTTRAEARVFAERIYHRPPWFLPLFTHELGENLARRAVRDLIETASNDDAPTPEALGALTMPILLVWGRSERLLPDTHLHYFRQHLPKHAVIERPDGFGHCPHFDAPSSLVRLIVSFAKKSLTH